MSLEKYTPKQIATITESTTRKYLKMPDYDPVAAGNAVARLDRLNAFAQRDLGLNLEHLKITLEAHELLLQSESEDPDNDQFIGFLREQIAFSQRMATTVQNISSTSLQVTTSYQRRLQAAEQELKAVRIAEKTIESTDGFKTFSELPDGFYKGKKLERFKQADRFLTETTRDFMTEKGISNYRLDRRFTIAKFLFLRAKNMYYVLHFWPENEPEPEETPYLPHDKLVVIHYRGDLTAKHTPILVPEKKKNLEWVFIEEAYNYYNDPTATKRIFPFIGIRNVSEENIRNLLTLVVEGKGIV